MLISYVIMNPENPPSIRVTIDDGGTHERRLTTHGQQQSLVVRIECHAG